ncbi:MAG: ribosome biogenesis GTP-binding protein YihA/YsxC [Bryobacteraceae bacterium]|nr:ribosome biogenesis GTP-binding protein YihA/YsxC [Bryobacteraceae bacterium]
MTVRAELIKSAAKPEHFPPAHMPEIAFLGRSNVGKSTLLNTLTGNGKLAFTSSTPGRTQVINFYRVDGRYVFVDLPGYGYARAPRAVSEGWKRTIDAYLTERPTLALSVILLDARRGWMETDLELKRWLEAHQRRYLVVATKVDKLNRKEEVQGLAAIRKELAGGEPVAFSAKTGRGVRELWQVISKTQNS